VATVYVWRDIIVLLAFLKAPVKIQLSGNIYCLASPFFDCFICYADEGDHSEDKKDVTSAISSNRRADYEQQSFDG